MYTGGFGQAFRPSPFEKARVGETPYVIGDTSRTQSRECYPVDSEGYRDGSRAMVSTTGSCPPGTQAAVPLYRPTPIMEGMSLLDTGDVVAVDGDVLSTDVTGKVETLGEGMSTAKKLGIGALVLVIALLVLRSR